jgi:hypothetical protein
MKKLLLALACVTLVGCDRPGSDMLMCHQLIASEYKTEEIRHIPNSWSWLIRTELGEVRHVTIGGYELKITRDVVIFPGKEAKQ